MEKPIVEYHLAMRTRISLNVRETCPSVGCRECELDALRQRMRDLDPVDHVTERILATQYPIRYN